MIKLIRPIINFISICIFASGVLISYSFFRPDFSKKQCETIRENYEQIKIGMDKEEVLLILDARVRTKMDSYAGAISPEQKTQWEVWLLCADPDSCIVINPIAKQCSRWQMVAFDSETEKVVKVFYGSPDRVGFY